MIKPGMTLSAGLVQLDAGVNKQDNLEKAFRLIEEAAGAGAQLVALPETFHVRGSNQVKLDAAEPIPGPLFERLGETAKRHEIYLLAGSYGERDEQSSRLYNTSLFFGPDGQVLAKYRKIHLFDVTVEGQFIAKESSRNQAGDKVVTVDTAFGRAGLSICYDLRFPELYRSLALKGAVVSFVPANFTRYTGKDHWEPLLRARAIENGMFVIAPAQIGGPEGEFQAYGRSLVVDPWGTVIACSPDVEGVTLARLDMGAVARIRKQLPSLEHRRPDAYELDVVMATQTS